MKIENVQLSSLKLNDSESYTLQSVTVSDCEDVLTEIKSADVPPVKSKLKTDVKVASMGTQGANPQELLKRVPLGGSKSVTWAPFVPQPTTKKCNILKTSSGKHSASKLLQARGILAQNLKQPQDKYDVKTTRGAGRQRPRQDSLQNLRTDPEMFEKLPILDKSQSPLGITATNPLTILKERGPTNKKGYTFGEIVGGRAGRNSFIMQHWLPPGGDIQRSSETLIHSQAPTEGKPVGLDKNAPQNVDPKCGVLDIEKGTWTDLTQMTRPKRSLVGVKFERFLQNMNMGNNK